MATSATSPSLTADEEREIEDEVARLHPPVEHVDHYHNVVVVAGLPVVDQAKYEKLQKVVLRLFAKAGKVVDGGVTMPQNDAGKSSGVAFIEYADEASAKAAVAARDDTDLDKAHHLRVWRLSDAERLLATPDEYAKPPPRKYVARDNLHEWLLDQRALDQYAIRFAERTELYWSTASDSGARPEFVFGRDLWTDTYVRWSPRGTYLATMHHQGVCLWGGVAWERIVRFQHVGVQLIDFAPGERYFVTFSPQLAQNDNAKDPKGLIVWDVRTGKKLRGFAVDPALLRAGPEAVKARWPLLQWSHDDRYVARLGKGLVSVYEAPSMNLLERRSVKLPGVKYFAWSPARRNCFAYYIPEGEAAAAAPARVAIVDIPSRKEVRAKNLYSVADDVRIHWHDRGDYLAVKVDRFTNKAKKRTESAFEVFRMCEKDVPIEVLPTKEPIAAMAWEPSAGGSHGGGASSTRFAVAHGDGPRYDVTFYNVTPEAIEQHAKLERRACNALFWAPRGKFIVLAGMGNLNGQLEFYNVDAKEVMGNDEHFMCSTVEWDPTGRYVTTVVSHWRQALETGFHLYSFSGQKLSAVLKDQFYQLVWRPRPPALLDDEKERYIRDNLGEYIADIAKEDKGKANVARDAEKRKREELRREWAAHMERARAAYDAERAHRLDVYGFDPDAPLDDSNSVADVRYDEEVVSRREEELES